MKKTLAALAAVALVAGAAVSLPTEASAQWRHGGWGPGAVIGGIIGGAVVGSIIAQQYGPQYVVEEGWEPYPVYRVRGPVGCPGGYWARQPRYDGYGNVVGYSRPRFFCPEG